MNYDLWLMTSRVYLAFELSIIACSSDIPFIAWLDLTDQQGEQKAAYTL
jgi:hypothetical protein